MDSIQIFNLKSDDLLYEEIVNSDSDVIRLLNFLQFLNQQSKNGFTFNDYVELICATTSTQVYLERYTASTSPFTRPSIPSSVITFTLVSPLPEMYVSSQGQGTATITHLANTTAGKTYKYAVIG